MQTSYMQFGFKQQHSTVMCSLLYHEVINHYLCNGSSNVYLLDASKEFDRVHYGAMFSILLNKNVPYCIIKFIWSNLVALMDWGGANSRFLGLVSVWAARSFDQTALRPSVIKRIRQN